MIIRFAHEKDLQDVLEVERLSFPSHKQWDYYDFKAALRDIFFITDCDGKIVGFIIACIYEGENRAVITRVAVAPEYRGRGIATRMIEIVIDYLRDMNMSEVILDVEIVKRGAISLYEKIGFEAKGIAHSDNEEEENFLTMAIKLKRYGRATG